jgi:tRNA modification GTPase
LTEWIDIEGFPVLLTDTAGLRDSADTVEILGQDRTKREIEDSDLVIFMIDGAAGITDEDRPTYEAIKDRSVLVAANKLDLGFPKGLNLEAEFPGKDIASISALKETGLEELKALIARGLHIDDFSLDTAILATERQQRAMQKVDDSLSQAIDELNAGQTSEVIALYLREALDHLGDLVGETTTEDILNDIFGRFCIGK